MICPKCTGTIVPGDKAAYCLSCGWELSPAPARNSQLRAYYAIKDYIAMHPIKILICEEKKPWIKLSIS